MKSYISILLCSLLSSALLSDTLTLKNGKVIEDVRAKLTETHVHITYSSGRTNEFKKVVVKSLKLKPVHWALAQALGQHRKELYEKERVRVADAFMSNTDWVIPEDEKPRLVFIKFQIGTGIPKEKAEMYSNLLKTKITKTNLFSVIDSRSIEKALAGKKCIGSDCAALIPVELRANKILTGTISRAGTHIFINADVIDIKKQKVDFSESLLIEELSEEGAEESVEFLAKKITGGTMEYLEQQSLKNPYEGKSVKWPMIWRSTLVPGWGQRRDGSNLKAISFFSATVISALVYAVSYRNLKKREKEYRDFNGWPYGTNPDFLSSYYGNSFWLSYMLNDKNHTRLKQAEQKANTYAKIVGGIWMINIIDVILFAEGEMPPKKKVDVKLSSDRMIGADGNSGFYISSGFSYRF
ncbi:MAG: hypothetical protein H7A25_07870 [Leptospiraceae bacterium]|nr:hypothetical protein [Leptospiraceae bacterium]